MCIRDRLQPDDYLGIVLFDDYAEVLVDLQKWSELSSKRDEIEFKISQIKDRGGTSMEVGYRKAVELIEQSGIQSNQDHRIFFLTDAMPNIDTTTPGGLLYMNKEAAQKGIYTTLFGIGIDFNVNRVEEICKTKGSCYYTITNEDDFRKLLHEDFDYMVFPIAFDMYTRMNKGKFMNVYGSNDTDIGTSGKLAYVSTVQPSNINEKGVKGGVLLLRMDECSIQEDIEIQIDYVNRDGEKVQLKRQVRLQPEGSNEQAKDQLQETFSDNAVRKAVLLTRYVNLIKQQDEEGRKMSEEEQNKQLTIKLSDEKKHKLQVFKSHFEKEMQVLGDDKLKEEIQIIDKILNQ
eukprot:TRINITY_DN731_c0_g1_i19.p1 TRINITY_DN731_c0_g1~~TRINITY_DN731_c0_g1_i19.p1  ORF type:complete len:346 (+),score=65.88 TRINITY_DN731_c0_g1_i19:65-1102(+)